MAYYTRIIETQAHPSRLPQSLHDKSTRKRRLEGWKVEESLQEFNCDMGTGLGVGQGMVVMGQIIATSGCHRLQLVVR